MAESAPDAFVSLSADETVLFRSLSDAGVVRSLSDPGQQPTKNDVDFVKALECCKAEPVDDADCAARLDCALHGFVVQAGVKAVAEREEVRAAEETAAARAVVGSAAAERGEGALVYAPPPPHGPWTG